MITNYLQQIGNYLTKTNAGRFLATLGILGLGSLFFYDREHNSAEKETKNNLEYSLDKTNKTSKIAELAKWQKENARPRKKLNRLERGLKEYKTQSSDSVSGKIDYSELSIDLQNKIKDINALLKLGGYVGGADEHWTEDCSVADFRTKLRNERGISVVDFTDYSNGYLLAYWGRNSERPIIGFVFRSGDDGFHLDLENLEFSASIDSIKNQRDIIKELDEILSTVGYSISEHSQCS